MMVIHVSAEQVPSLRFPINSNYQSPTATAPTSKMKMVMAMMMTNDDDDEEDGDDDDNIDMIEM